MLRQIAFDLRTWWRNGEQLLLMLLIPIGALIFGPTVSDKFEIGMQQLADATIVVAFFATAFTGQAILTAFDRRSNTLIVIGAGPLGRRGFLIARIASVFAGCLLQVLVLTPIAALRGFDGGTTLLHAIIALAGIPAFVSSGLLLAGLLRAELVLGVANFMFVAGATFGGAFNDVKWSPLGAVRDLQTGHDSLLALVVIGVWTGVASITAARTFRWVD